MEAVQRNPRFVAEMLQVQFLTTLESVTRILPPTLKPSSEPLVTAMVGRWRSNCVGDFRGGAINFACSHGDIEGVYTLAMYMDTFRSAIFGREILGEPKKFAASELVHDGSCVKGWVERDGVRLIELEADVPTELGATHVHRSTFNVKSVLRADGVGLQDDAVLTVAESEISLWSNRVGEGNVKLGGTIHDPLDEIPVVAIRTATFVQGELDTRCRPLDRIPADEFLPYAYGKLDYWPALDSRPANRELHATSKSAPPVLD